MSVSEALGKIALKATLFMRILEIFTKRNRFSSERDMKYMTRIFSNMDEFAPPYLCACSPVIHQQLTVMVLILRQYIQFYELECWEVTGNMFPIFSFDLRSPSSPGADPGDTGHHWRDHNTLGMIRILFCSTFRPMPAFRWMFFVL